MWIKFSKSKLKVIKSVTVLLLNKRSQAGCPIRATACITDGLNATSAIILVVIEFTALCFHLPNENTSGTADIELPVSYFKAE